MRAIRPLSERFWESVSRSDGCWEWIGTRQRVEPTKRGGYGIMGRGRAVEGNVYVHRLSYEIHFGPIPKGKCVLHRCDNRLCVRPDHLFLGSARDNAIDCKKKGRTAVGSRRPEAAFTEPQISELRRLYRNGVPIAKLADWYVVHPATMGGIVRGQRWKHVA